MMTAFTFRSCWVRCLPHGALGSVFNVGLSKLQAWPVLPSGRGNRGVDPDFTPRDLVKLLLYGRLPRSKIMFLRLLAVVRVR